jgi:hypothetical protein
MFLEIAERSRRRASGNQAGRVEHDPAQQSGALNRETVGGAKPLEEEIHFHTRR